LCRDPFAMLPFCGYNMADYFAHWLKIGEQTDASKLPKIFYVNWFRRSADGRFLWPGFGENSRVLAWVFDRVNGGDTVAESPIGWVPAVGGIDVSGLDITDADMAELLAVDAEEWRAEVPSIEEHFSTFGDRVPDALRDELAGLEKRLSD